MFQIMPDRNAIRQRCQRARNELYPANVELPELEINGQWSQTIQGDRFLIMDNHSLENCVIVFGSDYAVRYVQ